MHVQPEAWMAFFPFLFLVILIPSALLLTVLPFWFICRKAGFHGALSLIVLIPIGNIVLPFVLAFAQWPAMKTKTE